VSQLNKDCAGAKNSPFDIGNKHPTPKGTRGVLNQGTAQPKNNMEERKMKNFWNNEDGQGMVEYGLIIALVAVVVIVGLTALGGKANSLFSGLSDKLTMGSGS